MLIFELSDYRLLEKWNRNRKENVGKNFFNAASLEFVMLQKEFLMLQNWDQNKGKNREFPVRDRDLTKTGKKL